MRRRTVLRLPGPAGPTGVVAVPGLGLSVAAPARALRRLQMGSAAVALPGYGMLRDYTRTGLVRMARVVDAARLHRIDHALERVRCPVLVVRGRHDRIAPADWTAALAARAPRGRAATLPVGAHMVPITHPGALAAVIAPFLWHVAP